MKNKVLVGLLLVGMLGSWGGAQAVPVRLDVSLDTSPLIAGATGPYHIEFQLVDGDGITNSSVTVTNFSFGAGGATGSPTLDGGASGDLVTGVNLADSSFFNAFFQPFTPGSFLTFSLLLDTPVFVPPVPDRLTFALLNGSLFEIPTDGAGNELVGIDLRLPLLVETFSGLDMGSDPLLDAPTVAVVQEPGSIFLVLASLVLLRTRKRKS